ncbi:MAG: histidine--tRNA ligase [Candidatus Levybacteria bacterium]|nr:histidine--tRNA ligase [Candidatus Levybacteria bacterium]
MNQAQTLKGFRDFLPNVARKREYILNTLKKVFISYGFEPLETPTLEYEEILTGKYGDEGDKLMYRFVDNGGRKVAMRYDQTVPLARVVAQYANDLPLPFKRYQIQNVFRAENTQKGRYREFLQVDIDTVGSQSPLADAEIIQIILKCYESLGFKKIKMLINDRRNFDGISNSAIVSIDKLKKIGPDGVANELVEKGYNDNDARKLLDSLIKAPPSGKVAEVIDLVTNAGFDKSKIEFSPTLARGLDYYTGLIFEVEAEDYPYGSLGGGGRYDNLLGIFSGKEIPAVGFAVGFDRTYEAMEELGLFPTDLIKTQALVTNTNPAASEIANQLRNKGFLVELYVDDKDLEKQLKYADKKGIPYVLIFKDGKIFLKDMKSGNQKEVSEGSLPDELRR